jgi:exosortase
MSSQCPTSPEVSSPCPLDVRAFLRSHRTGLIVALASGVALTWLTLSDLVRLWSSDPDFSHGFLIPLAALWVLGSKREALGKVTVRRSIAGLTALLLALAVFLFGHATLTHFLSRIGAWGLLAGATWFLFGSELFRRASFPIAYLLLAVPPPQALMQPLRFELRGFATHAAADALRLLGHSATQEGSVLVVDAHRLEVADACSGIRSLAAILATAVLLAHMSRLSWLRGSLLVAASIPVTVIVNVGRILAIALGLSWFDVDLSIGARHDVLGFVVYGVSFGLLGVAWLFLDWVFAWKDRRSVAVEGAA